MLLKHMRYLLTLGLIVALVSEQACSAINFEFGPGLTEETTTRLVQLTASLLGLGAKVGLSSAMIYNGITILARDPFDECKLPVQENASKEAFVAENIHTEAGALDTQIAKDITNIQTLKQRLAYAINNVPGSYYRKTLGITLITLGMAWLCK